MRAVVQRVSRSKVPAGEIIVGEIGVGLLVLFGVTQADENKDADQLVDKIVNLRIFDDDEGKMNLSLLDVKGSLLIVSQFTLYGDTSRGRRPSFVKAAPGKDALAFYEYFVAKARTLVKIVETGEFGAMMTVELVNDGPVTILIDSDGQI